MKSTEQILIKNYDRNTKKYKLGHQEIIMLTEIEFEDLIKEIPYNNSVLPICLKSREFNVKKVDSDSLEYSKYHRNYVITDNKRVNTGEFIKIYKNRNLLSKSNLNEKTEPIRKLISNLIWSSAYFIIFTMLYISIIEKNEINFTAYHHFLFIIIIIVSLLNCGYLLSDIFKRAKHRNINYEIPILDEYRPYDASNLFFKFSLALGLAYYLIFQLNQLGMLYAPSIFIISVIILCTPYSIILIFDYIKNKREKQEIIRFLNQYMFENSQSSYDKQFILNIIIELKNTKSISVRFISLFLTIISTTLSLIIPLF